MSTTITFTGDTIKKGTPFPQGQRITYRYDPARGFTVISEFDGYDQTQLNALYQSYVQAGIPCEIELFLDKGILRVDDSTQEYTIDSWQILGNEETLDGLSHPTIYSIIDTYQAGAGASNGTTNDVYGELRAALAENLTTDDVFKNGDLLMAPYANTLVEFAYSLNQRGSPDYRNGQYVLRHSTNVSNRWQSNVADFGVDSIYTPAQLLSETTNSALWIYPLPPRLQYKIAAIPTQTAPLEGGFQNYLWGWLKSASTESTAANNRVDITTDYTLNLWASSTDSGGNTIYYPAYDGTVIGAPYY